mmetsp:Transcript_51308/g.80230  ORF Transcript_51308/g.80230 Transcript_51308/m.80230 type:complete len:205 (-) Transcript_51308:1927-2541(-)
MANAFMTLFKPIILYIINTVDRVARPHRNMFVLHFTESPLCVNGLAMLASPKRTSGTPSSICNLCFNCLSRASAADNIGGTTGAVSNDTPTCACFSAPTSFVPSPTIIVWDVLLKAAITCSFCWGDTRAKTVTKGANLSSSSSVNKARALPEMHRVRLRANSTAFARSKGLPSAESSPLLHSKRPALPGVGSATFLALLVSSKR